MKDLLMKLVTWWKLVTHETEDEIAERQIYGGP